MKQVKNITITLEREDIYKGTLILVNKNTPIRAAIESSRLAEVAPGVRLEKQAALLYKRTLQSIHGGAHIVAVSGYRTKAEQEQIFVDTMEAHGEEYAGTYVALPDCSEHQCGLAIDVGLATGDIDFVTPDFPYTGVSQQFRLAAARHGFIERYPKGKEAITGIGHEPWHFRYVGIPHSAIMAECGHTLEEYVEWIKAFPLHSRPYRYSLKGQTFLVGYVPAESGQTEIFLPGEPYTISGNNVDGFIIAAWRDDA